MLDRSVFPPRLCLKAPHIKQLFVSGTSADQYRTGIFGAFASIAVLIRRSISVVASIEGPIRTLDYIYFSFHNK